MLKRRISRFFVPSAALAGAAALLLCLAALGCQVQGNSKNEGEKSEAIERVLVETATAQAGKIARALTATSVLLAEREVDVISRVEGEVEKIFVEEGDAVRQGQTLAQLRSQEKRLLLESTRIRSENAAKELERNRGLISQGLISTVEFEKLEYQANIAKAEFDVAAYNLSETTIKALFDGMVTLSAVKPGQNVHPSQAVFRMADVHPLEAYLFLPEKDVRHVRVDAPVALALDADMGVAFEGKVDRISPVVDAATGTVKVTVRVDDAPKGVRPGSFVRARLDVDARENALLIPKRALLQSSGKTEVFVLEGAGKVKKAVIVTGYEKDDLIEVREGLAAGARVVTFGKELLRDGALVRLAAS